jgi:hypothetical protein
MISFMLDIIYTAYKNVNLIVAKGLTHHLKLSLSPPIVLLLLISSTLLYIDVQGHNFREDELAER